MIQDTIQYCAVCFYKSPIGLVPPMTYANPSYLTLVLVHRPGLWGHQISRPLNTSCGGAWRTVLLAKIKGKRTAAAVNRPADCIRENYTLRRATNSLWDAQNFADEGGHFICIQYNVTENWLSLILSDQDGIVLACCNLTMLTNTTTVTH
jgi:hypothetical protein